MSVTAPDSPATSLGDRFLAILPTLHLQFRIAFRRFRPDQRDDALHAATADAFAAFVRLWERGRCEAARPTPLARYAIWHWFAGRRLGTALNARDVSSPCAQRRQPIRLERLDRYDAARHAWCELMVADRRTPVPDQAAFRVDFPTWLRQLSRRNRRLALQLARGASTSDVAQRFQVSAGRVSQLRQEFYRSWLQFHGELGRPEVVTTSPE